jgi:site-specific recombinase XerD
MQRFKTGLAVIRFATVLPPIYSGSRWCDVRSEACNPYPVRHLLCCIQLGTAILQNGYDIRTVQELLVHKDMKTTMIYTHVLNRGGRGVLSILAGCGWMLESFPIF